MRNFILFVSVLLVLSSSVEAIRIAPSRPITHTITIQFNGETIKGFYCIFDARTDEEKSANLKNQKLNGSVIVFIQGHAQRPDDAYAFTSQLALKSKSGIVVVPVCDTPYGKNPLLRGDNGKDIILFAMIQHALLYLNINIQDDEIQNIPITINEIKSIQSNTQNAISANLTVIGWSHGALIARRLSSKYTAIKNLVQICPAGFSQWPDNTCLASCCVFSAFNWEGLRIATDIFKGHATDVVSSGWGITKGIVGDTYRSCGSCINGNLHVCKMFRPYKDITDVTITATDKSFPANHVNAIVVIFGKDDSLFNANKIIGYNGNLTPKLAEQFWMRYYPEAIKHNVRLNLFVLPGKHIAPVIYPDIYAYHALQYTDELNK